MFIVTKTSLSQTVSRDLVSENAFTRIELCTVVSIILLLGCMFGTSISYGGGKTRTVICMQNMQQLTMCWQLYHADNSDHLIMNFHGGNAQGGAAANNQLNAPWAVGWLDWTTAPDNTNTAFLLSERYSKLARFIGNSPRLFKCPADIYISKMQQNSGWTERVRSISMSVGVGDGNAESGPWESIYRHVKTVSDFVIPSPRESYVFADEHPDSMNDPVIFNPHRTSWIDQPATYHNGAASFSFADGHVESHKWKGSLAQGRATKVKLNNSLDDKASAGDPDIHWVAYHTPRVSDRTW